MNTKGLWETERGLLGCALMDPTILDECTVEAADFSRPPHENLWRLMHELHASGETPSFLVDVCHRVAADLDKYDGLAYVAGLPHQAVSVEAWRSYAREISNAAHRYRVLSSLKGSVEAIESGADPDEVMAATELRLADLSVLRASQTDPWRHLGDLAAEAFQAIQETQTNPDKRLDRVVPLPWPTVNRLLRGGMRRGEMVVLAGRPGTGKTAAALQAVEHASAIGGVLFVSLEMKASALVERDLARVAEVNLTNIGNASLDDLSWQKLARAVETLDHAPVWVLDTPALTASRIAALVKRKIGQMRARGQEVRMVVVDYLQLVYGEATTRRGGGDTEAQLLGEVSKALTALAKVTDTALLAVAQMNRNVENRGDTARPRMSDLRGSGQIEQDAAAILFTAKPEDPEICEQFPTWREIVIAKARHGETGDVPCVWNGEQMRLLENTQRTGGARP